MARRNLRKTCGKKRDATSVKQKHRGIYPLYCILFTFLFFTTFSTIGHAESLPYPILGYVTSCDNTSSYQGANVTVINPNTGVVKYDITESDGSFIVTFGNLIGPDEWYHDDPFIIWVNGTGPYKDWTGKHVTMFDKDTVPPHRVNVTICSSTTGDVPTPPGNLRATLGFTGTLYWVQLTWDAPTGSDSGTIATYRIYRGAPYQEKIFHGYTNGSTRFNDTGLTFNTTYNYWVSAVNMAGESTPATLVNITTRIPPRAQFTYLPHEPQPNETVLFMDLSLDPDGDIINWTWEITPGGIFYGEQISYRFTETSNYDVALTVTDNTGYKDTLTLSLDLSTDTNGTPGFEIIVLLVSLIGVVVLLYKKNQQA